MKIKFSKEDLVNGVQIVQSAVSSKATLPILSNLLLETQNGKTKFASTDLEMGIWCYVSSEIQKEGAITLPAKKLSDILHTMPENKEILINVANGNHVELSCGKAKFLITGTPKEEFPMLPDFPKKNFSLPAAILVDMLKKTSFAASVDEVRYVLNGVYLVLEKGLLRLVATDGRRLSFIEREISDKSTQCKAIIPNKAVQEILRMGSRSGQELKVEDELMDISVTENQVAVRFRDATLVSRLIEGQFPNYDQVIPKSAQTKVIIPSEDLFSITRRASICAMDRGGVVKYGLRKGKMEISASSQGYLEFEEELSLEYSGANLDIAFAPSLILDFLKSAHTDTVRFELSSSVSPGVLRPTGDDSHIYVVMPMKL